MRLWSVHPRYLDPQGLVALWREALLAQAVLRGETRGYRNHPQLERFRAHAAPQAAVSAYLAVVQTEATARGFRFDASKIAPAEPVEPLPVTTGQVLYEWEHLLGKLSRRSPLIRQKWQTVAVPDCHPLLRLLEGPVEGWERRG